MSTFVPQEMGWLPDLPDARDYTVHHPAVQRLLRDIELPTGDELPDEVDLRSDDEGEYFTHVQDQGPLNSSTAFAVLSLVEYFERRIHGRTFEGSHLFLYKVTRNCMARGTRKLGDSGADIRTTLKTLKRFGVPPAEHWPYDIAKFDEEPSAFLYGLAKPFCDLTYFRLDEPNTTGEQTWETMRSFLAAGFPIVFGFPVPSSLTTDPNIPYRPDFDAPRGGQAVLAIGYRMNHYGPGQHALLIRTSWGSQWGDNGNGWLPSACVQAQRTQDVWITSAVNADVCESAAK